MLNKFGFYSKFREESYSSTYAKREATGSFKVDPISFEIHKPTIDLNVLVNETKSFIKDRKNKAIKWTAGIILPLGVAVMATANPPAPMTAPDTLNQKQITSIVLWGNPNANLDMSVSKIRSDKKSFEKIFEGVSSVKTVDSEIYKCSVKSKSCVDGVSLNKLIASAEKTGKVYLLEENFNKFVKERMKLKELPNYRLSVDNSGKKPVYFFSLEVQPEEKPSVNADD